MSKDVCSKCGKKTASAWLVCADNRKVCKPCMSIDINDRKSKSEPATFYFKVNLLDKIKNKTSYKMSSGNSKKV